MARINPIVPESGVAHRDATGPSTPDGHLKHKTSIANACAGAPPLEGARVIEGARGGVLERTSGAPAVLLAREASSDG